MCLVEEVVGARLLLGELGVERQLERHDDGAQATIVARARQRDATATCIASRACGPSTSGHENRAVLERERRPE